MGKLVFPLVAVATMLGYFGGSLRNIGDRFAVNTEAEFSDVWMKAEGAANTAALAPLPVVKPAPVLVDIPADWKTIHYTKRIALAKAISGQDDITADQAVLIIAAEADQRDAIAKGIVQAPAASTLTAEQIAAANEAAEVAELSPEEAADRAAASVA